MSSLAARVPCLTHLDVSGDLIGAKGAGAADTQSQLELYRRRRALCACALPALQTLHFGWSSIEAEGMRALSDALSRAGALAISVATGSVTALGREGALPALKTLKLDNNETSDEECDELHRDQRRAWMRSMHKLQSLKSSFNLFTPPL